MPPKPPRMGGGGANSLNSPESGDNAVLDNDEIDPNTTQSWTEPTYKSYQDYFIDYFNLPSEVYSVGENSVTINYSSIKKVSNENGISLSYNGNVFDTITKSDLTGSGTELDPYIVGSTKGFLYMSNYPLFGKYLQYMTVEFACNIVLNEEKFDKNGNPSGGDGIVYQWEPIYLAYQSTFDGKNNRICGMYIKKEVAAAALFGKDSSNINIKNFVAENFYVVGKDAASGFAISGRYFENLKLLSGTINATSHTAGITIYFCSVKNCENYANVIGSAASGIAFCNILYKDTEIKNCINYGEVSAKSNVGGILSQANYEKNGSCKIEKCKNFGKILSNTNDGWATGGIVGVATMGELYIFGCESCGIVSRKYSKDTAAGMIGQAGGRSGKHLAIHIENCLVDIDFQYGTYIGILGHSEFVEQIVIKNVTLRIKNVSQLFSIISGYIREISFEIKNINVIAENCNSNANFKCFTSSNIKSGESVNIEGMHLKIDTNYREGLIVSIKPSNGGGKINAKSIIIETKNKNFYMGTDFSAFAYSWKTGKLNLVQQNVNTFFQGKVSEEWLENNGYQKREF